MIVLSYLSILFLIPLLTEKDDPEVQWHAKHGMVITIAEIILWVALVIVGMILNNILGGLGCIMGLVRTFLLLGFLVLRILCILKGVNGQRFIIPVLTDYVSRF